MPDGTEPKPVPVRDHIMQLIQLAYRVHEGHEDDDVTVQEYHKRTDKLLAFCVDTSIHDWLRVVSAADEARNKTKGGT